MLTIFFRAVILYGVSVWAIRMMGKRQIGQLQPYELVAAILIADLAAGPIAGSETPLIYGVVPIIALMLMHSFISRSFSLRRSSISSPRAEFSA